LSFAFDATCRQGVDIKKKKRIYVREGGEKTSKFTDTSARGKFYARSADYVVA